MPRAEALAALKGSAHADARAELGPAGPELLRGVSDRLGCQPRWEALPLSSDILLAGLPRDFGLWPKMKKNARCSLARYVRVHNVCVSGVCCFLGGARPRALLDLEALPYLLRGFNLPNMWSIYRISGGVVDRATRPETPRKEKPARKRSERRVTRCSGFPFANEIAAQQSIIYS